MKSNILYIAILFISFNLSIEYGGSCDDKKVLKQETDTITGFDFEDGDNNFYNDYKQAYNKEYSCDTLSTEEKHYCCYMKLKYKNKISDKKYTHTGCVELNSTQIENIDETIEIFENGLETYRNRKGNKFDKDNISKVSISIDCSSTFLKIFATALLSFLL